MIPAGGYLSRCVRRTATAPEHCGLGCEHRPLRSRGEARDIIRTGVPDRFAALDRPRIADVTARAGRLDAFGTIPVR